jgi:hypothetical protein
LFLLSAFLAAPAWGAPTITDATGTASHGSTITVTGTGFGTKGVAAPLKFDNFEGGSVGTDVANGWYADGAANCGAPIHRPIYSTTVVRTNSTKSVQCRFDEASDPGCAGEDGAHYSSSFGIANVPSPGLPVIYMDGWIYYSAASPESRNVKIIRVHTAFNGTPNLFVAFWCLNNSDGMIVGETSPNSGKYYDDCNMHGCPFSEPWHGTSWWMGAWRHVQLYLVQSSPNTHDGTIKLWTDGVLDPNATNWMNRTTSTYWNTAFFGNYVGHGTDGVCPQASTGNTFIYWDDAYVDTTLAHVEIGNASTYNACTQREIQLPTSWSNTSIQFTANQGAFADFNNKYVYVVDRFGGVSNGRQITNNWLDPRPTMTQPSNMTCDENTTCDQAITATDPNGDPLAFTQLNIHPFMLTTITTTTPGTGTGTGNIRLMPTYTDAGTFDMDVRVSDGVNRDDKTLTITVPNVNRAATLVQPDNMIVTEGQTADQVLFGADSDGDTITFSKVSGNALASVSTTTPTTGNLHLAPSVGDAAASPYSITVRASDGTANTDKSLSVVVLPAAVDSRCTPF